MKRLNAQESLALKTGGPALTFRRIGFLAFLWGMAVGWVNQGALAREPMVTDRPDTTESARVVPVGRFQLESGVSWETQEDGVESVAVGEVLLRWSWRERLELRLGLPSWERVSGSRTPVQGFGDPEVGVKVELFRAGKSGALRGFDGAILLGTTVPTGEELVSSGSWQPVGILLAAWDLGGGRSLGMNAGWERLQDGSERFLRNWFTAVFGFELGAKTGGFLEIVRSDPEDLAGQKTIVLQAGLTYLLREDLQVDFRVARRATSQGPDLGVGIGFSAHFDRAR